MDQREHPSGASGRRTGHVVPMGPPLAPDIVLLHLGTNDVAQNFTPQQSVENLAEIVGVLRNANPEVRIYLAKILPMLERWGMRERALVLNDSILVLAGRLGVHLVDQFEGMILRKRICTTARIPMRAATGRWQRIGSRRYRKDPQRQSFPAKWESRSGQQAADGALTVVLPRPYLLALHSKISSGFVNAPVSASHLRASISSRSSPSGASPSPPWAGAR